MSTASGLGWFGIVRLGLVQTALGAIVVLTTSTLNRVMVVEMALPATIPGLLVGLHYAIQLSRPRLGYGSDLGGRRTPWIVGGICVLALGGVMAALATAWMATDRIAGIGLAIVGFVCIGLGVGAAGTSLLVLLAQLVDRSRRAAAATIVWVMMIAGFIVTAATAGHLLDPFSPTRLVTVACCIAVAAVVVTLLAVVGVEGKGVRPEAAPEERTPFLPALQEIWAEPKARNFTIFVFVSMLAYSAQDLILEPFAGIAFGLTPGQSTQLSGVQNGGVLTGMVLVALAGTVFGHREAGSLRTWTVGGCLASAVALVGLTFAAHLAPHWPLKASVFALGLSNGAYAVAAIGSMMGLASDGRKDREGMRMGLWGAAQAVAFGLGGLLGTISVDIVRLMLGSPTAAYGTVFAAQAVLFVVSAVLAARVSLPGRHSALDMAVAGNASMAGMRG